MQVVRKNGDPAKASSTGVSMPSGPRTSLRPLGVYDQGKITQAPDPATFGDYFNPLEGAKKLYETYLEQSTDRRPDSILEDIAEVIDPTGIMSHDDFYKAIHEFKEGDGEVTGNQILDMSGAMPAYGSAGSLFKVIKRVADYYDSGQDIASGGKLEPFLDMFREKHTLLKGGEAPVEMPDELRQLIELYGNE